MTQVGHCKLADAVEIARVARGGELAVIGLDRLPSAEIRSDVGDVFAVVGRFWPAGVCGRQAIEPRLDGRCQRGDLHPGIVVIELPRDLPTLRCQQIAQRVAQRSLAGVTQVQGSGRVGRDELDQRALAVRCLHAEARRVAQHLGHHGLLGRGRQTQVDEAGPSDLEGGDPTLNRGLSLQRGDQLLGNLSWTGFGRTRHLHRHGDGQIAVRRLLRRFKPQVQAMPGRHLGGGLAQGVEQLLLGLDHV